MYQDKKVKVFNRSKGKHGFRFMDANKVITIPAGGFMYIPIDEVYYTNTSTTSFSSGILEIDPMETELLQDLGYEVKSINSYSVDEFKNILKVNFLKNKDIKEKLSELTQTHARQNLIEAARDLDLSASKVKYIKDNLGIDVTNDLFDDDPSVNKKDDK